MSCQFLQYGRDVQDKIGGRMMFYYIKGTYEESGKDYIIVDNNGYSPAVVVLQKGIQAKIKFNPAQLNGCNSYVEFPEYQGGIDLKSQTETPWLPVQQDFSFQCGMGMLHGFVKVVDDINKVNLDDIKKAVKNYTPPTGSGGGGCCGG
jgi:plastocyanin domain-containing protein